MGYTPAVRMPNQRTQHATYIDARQAFRIGVHPDQDSRLNNCNNWDRDLVDRFACAYYFPPCSENGTVLPPCRSLCTGYDFYFAVDVLVVHNRPLSRCLDRCDRMIRNESRYPNGGNVCLLSAATCPPVRYVICIVTYTSPLKTNTHYRRLGR